MGINPERGGRPPKESRTRGVIAVSAGVLAQEAANVFTVVAELVLKIINVEKVMGI